jgi:hypothetical protein
MTCPALTGRGFLRPPPRAPYPSCVGCATVTCGCYRRECPLTRTLSTPSILPRLAPPSSGGAFHLRRQPLIGTVSISEKLATLHAKTVKAATQAAYSQNCGTLTHRRPSRCRRQRRASFSRLSAKPGEIDGSPWFDAGAPRSLSTDKSEGGGDASLTTRTSNACVSFAG